MAEQPAQTVVDQNVLTAANAAPTSTPNVATTHIQTQQQLLQQQQNQAFMAKFWNDQLMLAERFESDFKNHPLPLARIKKVMKSDQDVKMISAEAPILFSKACEIFISEITKRAWIHAEENKRRTLQRSDVASAVSRSDQFDFLIDIVPREEVPKAVNRRPKEEPSADQMFAENGLAYFPGIQYPTDPNAYYQQIQQEQLQLQEQIRRHHQELTQRQQQSDTTPQTVTNQQEQTQHPLSPPELQKIQSSVATSTSPSDGSVIEDQIQDAVNIMSSVVHSKQQEKSQSKNSRKLPSKKSKK